MPTTEERYLEQAIDRYSSEVASTARSALKIVCKRYPGARRLVYDRRGLEGAGLEDPEGRLEGSGGQVRSIRLEAGAKILNDPYVRRLMTTAVKDSGRDLKNGDSAIILKPTL